MPGCRADLVESVGRVREECEGAEQTRGDEERLGDRGVPDGLSVRLGPVVGEVEAGDGGQPADPVGEDRVFEPRSEETRSLRTLARSNYDEHLSSLS